MSGEVSGGMNASAPGPPQPATAVVKVNGVEIPPQAIAAEAQHHPAAKPEAAWQAAAEALVIRQSLLNAARARGLRPEPIRTEGGGLESEDDALIRALSEREVVTPEPDEASCRRYYENNRGKLRSPDLWEPSHILLQADRDDAPAYRRAREEAQALIDHLRDHPEAFERMARERSDCASASDGGSLGQVTKGQTTAEFEAAMLSLQPGEVCPEPVETPYGFHVLRLDRASPGSTPPFETARPLVEEFLRDASWRRAVAQFVSLVVGESEIEGVEMKGATSPLVQ